MTITKVARQATRRRVRCTHVSIRSHANTFPKYYRRNCRSVAPSPFMFLSKACRKAEVLITKSLRSACRVEQHVCCPQTANTKQLRHFRLEKTPPKSPGARLLHAYLRRHGGANFNTLDRRDALHTGDLKFHHLGLTGSPTPGGSDRRRDI